MTPLEKKTQASFPVGTWGEQVKKTSPRWENQCVTSLVMHSALLCYTHLLLPEINLLTTSLYSFKTQMRKSILHKIRLPDPTLREGSQLALNKTKKQFLLTDNTAQQPFATCKHIRYSLSTAVVLKEEQRARSPLECFSQIRTLLSGFTCQNWKWGAVCKSSLIILGHAHSKLRVTTLENGSTKDAGMTDHPYGRKWKTLFAHPLS